MSDARAGHIELAAHASALAEAVRAGRAYPRAGSSACPNSLVTTTGPTWRGRLR
jgi:hypothetical protein